MKKNSAARNGKCFFHVSPRMLLHMSSRTNSTTYSTPLTNVPCGTSEEACFFLNTKITTSMRARATANQKV